jgi:predicted DNA-binding transcriptional regulator YafY
VTEYAHTTQTLATELGVSTKTIRKRAAKLNIGIDLEGRAGFRYSDADRRALLDSLRPEAPAPKRRKRRAA